MDGADEVGYPPDSDDPESNGTHAQQRIYRRVDGWADMTQPCREEPGSATVEEHTRLRVRGGNQGGEHGDDSGDPGEDGRSAEIVVSDGQKWDR